jgi:hypothetical protein
MLSLALAGKPNAGKSTFYTAATMADVSVANYPFTTIDANRGISYARARCPCLDRDERCGNCRDGKRYVAVELVDVAGLVPGAHEGRGLGNQFLDQLTNADAILNIVDASGGTDEEGEPVEVGTYDPLDEVDFIREEMDRWLAGIIDRNWESIERQSRSPDFAIDDALAELLTGFGASEYEVGAALRELAYPDDPIQWTAAEKQALAREIRERTKPFVLVGNKADVAPEANLDRLREVGIPFVAATADGERALRKAAETGVVDYDPGDDGFEIRGDLTDEQRTGLDRIRAVIERHGGTGVQGAIDTAVYDLLDHVTVYPVQNESKWTDGQGETLPDAFLLPRGSTPTDLAYAVHSDIGDGYLHAVDARSNRRISESYELEEGDVIKIVSTAN